MSTRQHTIDDPFENTCQWLQTSETYCDWLNNRELHKHQGLLWIKGLPGSGKSTLIKEAIRNVETQQNEANGYVASFFFNARGKQLEQTRLGLLRSLLYQLLPNFKEAFKQFVDVWDKKVLLNDSVDWHVVEVKHFLQALFQNPTKSSTTIFVDALDECRPEDQREVATFFRDITASAFVNKVRLRVCISSRHFPSLTIPDCLEITMENFNHHDIAGYVAKKLSFGTAQDPETHDDGRWAALRRLITEKASGVFLWAVLVVDRILRDIDDGRGLKYLEARLVQVPLPLEELYVDLIGGLDSSQIELAVRLFQWVLLAARPLRIFEWYHVLAFIVDPSLKSLNEWEVSEDFIENENQLAKRIRSISRGLVEVKYQVTDNVNEIAFDEVGSILAGAGSFVLEQGTSGIVQFVHESVREFFFSGKGFATLNPRLSSCPIGSGHLSILETSINFIRIRELDALISGRADAHSRSSYATTKISSYFDEWRRANPEERYAVKFYSKIKGDGDFSGLEKHGKYEDKPRRRGILRRTVSQASFGSSASHYALSTHSNSSSRGLHNGSNALNSVTSKLDELVKAEVELSKPPLLQQYLDEAEITVSKDDLDKAVRTETSKKNDLDEHMLSAGSLKGESIPEQATAGANLETPEGSEQILPATTPEEVELLEGEITYSKRHDTVPSSEHSMDGNLLPTHSKDPSGQVFSTPHEEPAIISKPGTDDSQTFNDFPALTSYAINALLKHASAADSEGCDPKAIIQKLQQNDSWNRWLSLKEGISANTTLLYFAAEHNLLTWARCLLDQGGDCNEKGGELIYPLIVAANRCHPAMFSLLMENNAKLLVSDRKQRSALHHLAASTDVQMVREFFMHLRLLPPRTSSGVNFEDVLGQTVNFEDAFGQTVNLEDVFGQTPLHLAAWQSTVDVVEELLKNGGQVQVTDKNWDTPMHVACDRDVADVAVCRALLSRKPNVDAVNRQGLTPLELTRSEEVARLVQAQSRAKSKP